MSEGRSHVQYMLRIGEYLKLQFLVATGLISRPCGKLGRI